mgnify:CR=1 FL=1
MEVPKKITLIKPKKMSSMRFNILTERIVKSLEELGVKVERTSIT